MDIESHRFISFFESEQAAELCQRATVENFTNQTILFEEGEKPDFLYLVLAGRVEFRKKLGTNHFQTLATALPNGYFGELGILDGQPRSAQAIVYGGTVLGKIERHHLMEIVNSTKGSVVVKLFNYTIQRLRESTEAYVKQLVYKERMVLMGEMLNTVIHDLNSPLIGIHLSSSVLKEVHTDTETAQWCDLIQAQAKRISAMTEDLLEFAQGNTILRKQPLNLAQALEIFQELNSVYLREAQVELVIQAEDVVVNADENKLMRVWQNLLNNAVESFNGHGGRVEIKAWEREKQVQIEITDNGPGIPEVIRERLFESFVTYGKGTGTGLGTAIAKSIIDAHGGKISFESYSQHGTTFYISLPLEAKALNSC
ncbi:MAG: cyclic nucleotide-binding domain-containing protein [Symploca sp. SIO2E9]|nr:cyclic nucleotide-binding domain-containing protein [Symploca sp. SIO2E9]